MSFLQQLQQVTPSLLIAIRDDKLDSFYSSFAALTKNLSAAVITGTASQKEMTLMDEVGRAVEVIVNVFMGMDQAEDEARNSLQKSLQAIPSAFKLPQLQNIVADRLMSSSNCSALQPP
jgi:hypothetical protein